VLSVATAWIRFEAVLYLLFNVALVLVGLYLTGLRPLSRVEGWGLAAWQAIASRIKTKVIVAGTKRELALGVLWGLVPCAAIYSVLPLAILTGSAIHGAVLLLSFGLGTIPGHLALERSFSAATALSVGRSFAWAPRLLGVLVVCWGLAGVSFAVGLTERPSAILASLCGAR
jgi:sulfite exporter TauE/SafE